MELRNGYLRKQSTKRGQIDRYLSHPPQLIKFLEETLYGFQVEVNILAYSLLSLTHCREPRLWKDCACCCKR